MKQKVRDFIAKVLGLPTQEQISTLVNHNMELQSKYDGFVTEVRVLREEFNQTKIDMRDLYSGLEGDIRNVKSNVKQIKPVLKVEDPEAVKFIKDILKKHDINMQNNQTDLHQRVIDFREAKSQVTKVLEKANAASNRLNNVLNGLGMMSEYDSDTLITTFRDLVTKSKVDDKAFDNVSK